jgi:hypothetical protein
MLAILLAVGFSAFTKDNGIKATNAVEDELYWYSIDASGNIGTALNSGALATKSEVSTEADCPDVSGDDCARGYESTQTFGNPAPGVSGADRHIMKED